MWQCNKCNCKTAQLSRIFGAWPPPGLEAAPKDQLQAFFRNTHGLNPVATKAKFDESLSGHVVSEEYFDCEGEYLPPAVWATRGFDAERTAGLHSLLYVVHSSIAAFRLLSLLRSAESDRIAYTLRHSACLLIQCATRIVATAHPSDIRDHPRLGKTYRVALLKTWTAWEARSAEAN